MRKEYSPAKRNPEKQSFLRHRVIIPVHIPNLEGYYEKSLEITNLCLESLHISTRGKASITVISNNCHPEVVGALKQQFNNGWFDQLVINRKNLGKINACVSVARGAFEQLITISDGDMLFRPGWLEAIEELFDTFPECGISSPIPNPGRLWYCTTATLLSALIRRELSSQSAIRPEDLDFLGETLGVPDMYKNRYKQYRNRQVVVTRDNISACLGLGHLAVTIRKEVCQEMPEGFAPFATRCGADHDWLDRPPDEMGLWRLAPTEVYAYHMGNLPEQWMYDKIENYRTSSDAAPEKKSPLPPLRRGLISHFPLRLRRLIVAGMRESGLLLRLIGHHKPTDG